MIDGNGRNTAHIINLTDDGKITVGHGSLLAERGRAVLPGVRDTEPFAYRVNQLVNGTNRNSTSYLTPTQFGLLYADGRWYGVLLGYLFSGAMLGAGWRALTRRTSVGSSLFAACAAVLLGKLAITGAPGLIASLGVAALAVAIVLTPAWISTRLEQRRLDRSFRGQVGV
jgi:hypothetical protein